MLVKGDAASTTKSASIDVRENPHQDLSDLSRDWGNALNELGRIFDKKKIEEQQELAAVFGEEAYRRRARFVPIHGRRIYMRRFMRNL